MTTFNPELVDEDNPELTRADFAAMIPAVKFFADRGLPPEAQPVKPTDDKRESNGKLLYSNGKPLLKPGQMTVGEYAKTPEGKEWGKLISSTFDNIFHHYQSFIDTFEHLVEMK